MGSEVIAIAGAPGSRTVRPLAGTTLLAGDDPVARVARAHAEALGATISDGQTGLLELRPAGGTPVTCEVELQPEPIAQARCGLMTVHGRDCGRPRRLGLAVASVATGIASMQALLALLAGQARGSSATGARTSTLNGALAYVIHHLALAGAGDAIAPTRDDGDGPGPPFPSADGAWVELEAMHIEGWIAYWGQLGVATEVAAGAWSSFVLRYLAGACRLPVGLHEASRRHPLAALEDAASASGVVLCPLRAFPATTAADSKTPWTFSAQPASLPMAVRQPPSPQRDGPLAGLRVVELATRLQGPLAGRLLRLLGADVTRVEPPGGDIGRRARGGFGFAAYRAYNRGKELIELDIKTSDGRGELRRLIGAADVFLHNSPAGRAEALGFGYDEVRRANPGLVYAHASGWGAMGPATIAGDFLVQAQTGLGALLNPPHEPPFPTRITVLDVCGGLLACEAILVGLCLRQGEGCGCAASTSLVAAADQLRCHGGRLRWFTLEQPIRTSAGDLVVAAGEPWLRRRLAAVCGLPGDSDDVVVARRLRTRSALDCARELSAAGIPATLVPRSLLDVSADVEVAERLHRVDGVLAPRAPWSWS